MDTCICKTDSLCCTAETQQWKSTMKVNVLAAQSCRLFATPSTVARLLCPWNSPDTNTEAVWHSLFLGNLPTQGSNPGLPHCRQTPVWATRAQGSSVNSTQLKIKKIKKKRGQEKNCKVLFRLAIPPNQEKSLKFFCRIMSYSYILKLLYYAY